MPADLARVKTRGVVSGRRRVLVIDNDPTILRVVHRILDGVYEVIGITDAKNAIAVISTTPQFDAVLCDFLMPGLSGQEFYRRLSSSVPLAARRVIFITGAASLPETQAFLSSIPNVVLEKPFTSEALRNAVREVSAS